MSNLQDTDRGLYDKFVVTRTDGSSLPGGKHHGCTYFVLDLTHDPHAKAAIAAYADSCAEAFPKLAEDLRKNCQEDHSARIKALEAEIEQLRADRARGQGK